MKEFIKNLIYIISSILVMFIIFELVAKFNQNGVGKYTVYNGKFILDTTNGNVFAPSEKDHNKYTWEKVIFFENKE